MARRSYKGNDSLSEWYYRGYNKAYYENYHEGYNAGYTTVYNTAYSNGEALARNEGAKNAYMSFESMNDYIIKGVTEPYNMLRFTAISNNSTIGYTNYGGNKPIIYWRKKGGEWTVYDSGANITLNAGEYVEVYGDNIDGFSKSTSVYTKFNITGAVECSGKVSALISGWIDTFEIPCDYCFYRLFRNCYGLLTAPELPAITLAMFCYKDMFYGCSSLTTAPELPATTLTQGCYMSMFSGCSGLTTAPELPAKTLHYQCYQDMFSNCSNLTTAPELPATTLTQGCYMSMFSGCSGLTTAPELPAKTLAMGCYAQMFSNCSNLTTAPELPATTLVFNCYPNMFQGCKKLQFVTTYATTWNTSYASNWLSGAGTEAFNPTVFCPIVITSGNSGIPSTWKRSEIGTDTVVPPEYMEDYNMGLADGSSVGRSDGQAQGTSSGTSVGRMNGYYNNIKISFYENLVGYTENLSINDNTTGIVRRLAFTAPSTGSELNIVNYGNNDVLLFYSFDGKTWLRIVFNGGVQTETVTITNNDSKTTYLMGFNIGPLNKSSSKYINITKSNIQTTITSSGDTGDINALKLGINIGGYIRTARTYDFYGLFKDNTTLLNSPELPATTLASNCYQYMFQSCKSLTTAPELPATTLANYCYSTMFGICSSLTTTPELPATTLANFCYQNMFYRCTSLTTAPELPATTLVSSCYAYMFSGCTSLTTAPELPATTLASYCYQNMFQNCTSLTTAPELPATTLAIYCYYQMFYYCTSLTTAPTVLPATTLTTSCYQSMFQGCTSLNYIKVHATTWNTSYASNWVSGVQNITGGVFYKPTALGIGTGTNQIPQDSANGIPTGWTVENF